MYKLITNAYVPTKSAALKKVNVLFDSKIIKVSQEAIFDDGNLEIIDLRGKLLLPGAVDMHCQVSCNDPDPSTMIPAITQAAISGGWTTLADLDCHAVNPIFRPSDIDNRKQTINDRSWCDIALWGHVDVDDYPYYAETAQELWNSGVIGLIVLNPSPSKKISSLSYTEIMDLFLDIYAYDTLFTFDGYDNEISTLFTPEAHMSAVKKLLRRMQENPLHICQVSHYNTLEFINSISKRSDISCAVKIPDLMREFSAIDIPTAPINSDFASFSKELDLLLRTNKIYVLSNFASTVEQFEPEFLCYTGENYELMRYSVTYILSELWKKRKVPLATCVKMISENPAKRLGLYPRKGSITVGADADFIVFDQNEKTETGLRLRSGNPLILEGTITDVYLGGTLVTKDGKPNFRNGSLVRRTASPKKRHNTQSWI